MGCGAGCGMTVSFQSREIQEAEQHKYEEKSSLRVRI